MDGLSFTVLFHEMVKTWTPWADLTDSVTNCTHTHRGVEYRKVGKVSILLVLRVGAVVELLRSRLL